MTKRLHVNTTEGANNPRQAWSRSPSPLTSEAQFLTFHPQRPPPSWSHRPLHPITMKRPIRQISKDGRRRVITHDVSGQIEKKKKRSWRRKTSSDQIYVSGTVLPHNLPAITTNRTAEDYRRHGRKREKKDVTLISPCAGLGNSPSEERSVLR